MNPTVTVRSSKMPKHIAKIAMGHEKYYELKVHIKSIVAPGTVPFKCTHFTKENKQIYRQWLNNALEEIGPRFFPGGEKGLVWPEDYKAIYKAVHQVVRVLSLGIRKNHKKESGATLEEGYNEMEITKDGDSYEGKDVNATHVTGGREDVILDKDEKHAQSEEEEKKAMATTIEKDQENQAKDAIKEMDAEPIELEELLSLMKPEVFAHFQNLEDEYFDWDEIMDPSNPELIARLLLLLS